MSFSIHVYGTNWCGYTTSQVQELNAAIQAPLQGTDLKPDDVVKFHDCEQDKDGVCEKLPGFPLTVVLPDQKPVDAAAVAKEQLGKRPAAAVIAEWKKACDGKQ